MHIKSNIAKNDIWVNKQSGTYVQVKEATTCGCGCGMAMDIVFSDETVFIHDCLTNVRRTVLTFENFISEYVRLNNNREIFEEIMALI